MIKRQSLGSYIEELPAVGRRTAILNCGEYRRVGWSYGDLYWAVKAFALEVTNRGLVKGDRVLLVGENSPGWVAAFLGCLDRGLVVVPLEVTGSPEFVAKVQKKVQAKLLVADPRVSLPGFGIPVFPVDRVVPSTGSFGVSLSDPEIHPDDTAEIVFTSGTTAEPKGVILTHQNILANLIPIEEGLQRYQPWVRLFRARRILVLLPLSHMFGQVIGVFVPIIFRWTSIFTYTFNPPVLIRTIRRYGVLALATVPRILQFLEEALLRDLEKAGTLNCFREKFEQMKGRHPLRRIWAFRDIHWRFGPRFLAVLTGGAALAPEQEEFWVRLGFAVIQGYGLTETAPIVTIKHPFKRKLGSVRS